MVSGHAVRSGVSKVPPSVLTGANAIPVKSMPHRDNFNKPKNRRSVFDRIVFPSDNSSVHCSSSREGFFVFDRLVFPGNVAHERQSFSSEKPPLTQRQFSSARVRRSFNGLCCSRCLATSHSRNQCNNAIKCLACGKWGHVEANCFKTVASDFNFSSAPVPKGNLTLASSSWFSQQPTGPSSSRPPTFNSFGEFMGFIAQKSF